MRLTKALGLAVIAAVAAMAFAGTGSAFGQTHEIVLCKELVNLCPNGKLWPRETKLLFLAPGTGAGTPVMLGALNFKCEDSIGTGVLANEIGVTLPIEINDLRFGKLPTPQLGEGCTGCTEAHVAIPIASEIQVEAGDKYFLKISWFLALLCPFIGKCVFSGENLKAPILHTGKHLRHEGEKLALIEFSEVQFKKVEGIKFCGEAGKWDADYIIYLADPPAGEPGLVWPSLDKKA